MNASITVCRDIASLAGPTALPLIGNLWQLELSRAHQILEGWAQEYGPIFRFRAGTQTRLCIADAETIQHMLRERPHLYRRRRMLEDVMTEMGLNGVFSAEGEVWRRQRKVVAQALNPDHLHRFYPDLLTTAGRLERRWRAAAADGNAVDLCADLMRFTVDVTARLSFGLDVNTLETDGPVIQKHLDKVFPMLHRRVVAPFGWWRYFKRQRDRELDLALVEIERSVAAMVADCRERMQARPELFAAPDNFLEAILAAQARAGTDGEVPFTDAEIYANVVTLLLAGEDTTANTIAWAVHLLIQHPEAARLARAEVDSVLGDASLPASPEAVRQLDFIEACALETMRLKPVAPVQGIEPLQDVELLGVRVPAGTSIIALTRPGAMSSDNFAEAEAFNPGRWLDRDGVGDGPHNPRAFMPFGAGPRFCPGRGLALLEIKVVLALLLRSFDVAHAGTADDVAEQLAFTMFPADLRVCFNPRRGPVG